MLGGDSPMLFTSGRQAHSRQPPARNAIPSASGRDWRWLIGAHWLAVLSNRQRLLAVGACIHHRSVDRSLLHQVQAGAFEPASGGNSWAAADAWVARVGARPRLHRQSGTRWQTSWAERTIIKPAARFSRQLG